MTMTGSREAHSVREALLIELLGDVALLLQRAEAVAQRLDQADRTLQDSTVALAMAGERYRQAALSVPAEAKAYLADYIRRTTEENAGQVVQAKVDLLDSTAREVLRRELEARTGMLLAALEKAAMAQRPPPPPWHRLRELAVVASLAGLCSAGLAALLLR